MNGLNTSLKVGLHILTLLARPGKDPLTVREMAAQLNQSEKYLEQLLLPMRRARLVMSVRGPHGGYLLARPSAQISLLEIMQLLQGPITFCNCPSLNCQECVNPPMWQALETCIETSMASVTLDDVIAERRPKLPGRIALGSSFVEHGLGI